MLRSYGRLLTRSTLRHIRYTSTSVAHEPEVPTKPPRKPRLPKIDTKPRGNVSLTERQASLEASLLKPSVKAPARRMRKAAGEPLAASGAKVKAELEAESAVDPDEPKKRTRKERATNVEAVVSPGPKRPVTRRKRTAESVGIDAATDLTPEASTTTPPAQRCTKKTPAIPPRLLPPTDQKHHDLPSFLDHATRNNLNVESTVYRGTHFEYIVAAALHAMNFKLQRTGRSNDLGIDLVGHWSLPTERKKKSYEVPVILQCKAARPTPSMIRELEGAYTGAPAGWRGEGVLALLANVHPSTKGVREAVQRSRWPLGVLQVTRDGEVKQFLWNAVAAQAGLEGLGVALRYASKRGGLLEASESDEQEEGAASSIGLTWLGKPWLPSAEHAAKADAAAIRALLST